MTFALRQALRRPLFPFTAIVLLSLGLGATGVFFAALDALVWRPLPFADAAAIRVVLRDAKPAAFAQPVAQELGAGIAFRTWGLTAADARPLEVVLAGMVTPDFFRFLGVEPFLGRSMRGRELWLSHDTWRTRFNADPQAVGRVVALNEEPYTITGVLPPGFTFGAVGQEPGLYFPLPPGNMASLVLTRSPGDAVRAIAARTGDKRSEALATSDLKPILTGEAARPYRTLLAATSALLLITCLNLSSLLLARTFHRRAEWATRSSLGATPLHLLKQFATEAALISAGGLAGAFLVAQTALRQVELGGLFTARLDPRVALVLGGVALLITALFALSPALWLRGQALFSRGPQSPRTMRWRGMLVAAQVALSLALLTAAGLLLRSFDRLTRADPGFQATNVTVAGFGLPEVRYDTDAKLAGFHEAALRNLSAIPGVQHAAAGVGVPFTGAQYRTRFDLGGVETTAEIGMASPELFDALGIAIKAGRVFHHDHRLGTPRVALVNQAFVRAFYPNRSPLGERLKLSWWGPSNPRGVPWEVIGIVEDVRTRTLEQAAEPRIWLPLAQFPSEGVIYVVRTQPGVDVRVAMKQAVAQVDGSLEKLRPSPLADRMQTALEPRQMTLRVTTAFAIAALALCAFGIFSVSAYAARARKKEFAIRAALGEPRPSLWQRLLTTHLHPVLIGTAIGAVLAAWTGTLLANQLFETAWLDTGVLATVVVALALAAVAAAAWPAWQASAVDPAEALREN